jgi:hypothetical protein
MPKVEPTQSRSTNKKSSASKSDKTPIKYNKDITKAGGASGASKTTGTPYTPTQTYSDINRTTPKAGAPNSEKPISPCGGSSIVANDNKTLNTKKETTLKQKIAIKKEEIQEKAWNKGAELEDKMKAKTAAFGDKIQKSIDNKIANSKAIIGNAAKGMVDSLKDQIKNMITSLLVVPEPVLLLSLQGLAKMGGTPMYGNYYVLKAILKKDYVTIIEWFVSEYKWSVVSGDTSSILNSAATTFRATRCALYVIKEKIKIKGPAWWRSNKYGEIKKIIAYGKTHFNANDILDFMKEGRIYVSSDTIVSNAKTFLDKILDGLNDAKTELISINDTMDKTTEYIYTKTPDINLIVRNQEVIDKLFIKIINVDNMMITRETIAELLACDVRLDSILGNTALSGNTEIIAMRTSFQTIQAWINTVKTSYDHDDPVKTTWKLITNDIDAMHIIISQDIVKNIYNYVSSVALPMDMITRFKNTILSMKYYVEFLPALNAVSSPSDTIIEDINSKITTIENLWDTGNTAFLKMNEALYSNDDAISARNMLTKHANAFAITSKKLKTIKGEIKSIQSAIVYVKDYKAGTAPPRQDVTSEITGIKTSVDNIIADIDDNIPDMAIIKSNMDTIFKNLKVVKENIYVAESKIDKLDDNINFIEAMLEEIENSYAISILSIGAINPEEEWETEIDGELTSKLSKLSDATALALSGIGGAKPVIDDLNSDTSIYPGGLGENGCIEYGTRFKFEIAEINKFLPEKQNKATKTTKDANGYIKEINTTATKQGLWWETYPSTTEHVILMNKLLNESPTPQNQYRLEHKVIFKRLRENVIIFNPVMEIASNTVGALLSEYKIDKLIKFIQDPSSLMYLYIRELEKNKLF